MSNFPAFYEHNRERPISRSRFCKRSVARSYGYAKKLIVGKDASEPMENTCTQGPGPGFWRGYLKKVVFSLLPSEYRPRAPSVRAPIFSLAILVFIELCLPNFSQHYFNVYLSFIVKDECFFKCVKKLRKMS